MADENLINRYKNLCVGDIYQYSEQASKTPIILSNINKAQKAQDLTFGSNFADQTIGRQVKAHELNIFEPKDGIAQFLGVVGRLDIEKTVQDVVNEDWQRLAPLGWRMPMSAAGWSYDIHGQLDSPDELKLDQSKWFKGTIDWRWNESNQTWQIPHVDFAAYHINPFGLTGINSHPGVFGAAIQGDKNEQPGQKVGGLTNVTAGVEGIVVTIGEERYMFHQFIPATFLPPFVLTPLLSLISHYDKDGHPMVNWWWCERLPPLSDFFSQVGQDVSFACIYPDPNADPTRPDGIDDPDFLGKTPADKIQEANDSCTTGYPAGVPAFGPWSGGPPTNISGELEIAVNATYLTSDGPAKFIIQRNSCGLITNVLSFGNIDVKDPYKPIDGCAGRGPGTCVSQDLFAGGTGNQLVDLGKYPVGDSAYTPKYTVQSSVDLVAGVSPQIADLTTAIKIASNKVGIFGGTSMLGDKINFFGFNGVTIDGGIFLTPITSQTTGIVYGFTGAATVNYDCNGGTSDSATGTDPTLYFHLDNMQNGSKKGLYSSNASQTLSPEKAFINSEWGGDDNAALAVYQFDQTSIMSAYMTTS